jgi:hypothetical protein
MHDPKGPLTAINVPSWDGTPRECGEVWRLSKGAHVAVCSLFTHPKGGEVRLTIDGEWHRGSVAVDGRTLLDVALDWKQQFEAKGWN